MSTDNKRAEDDAIDLGLVSELVAAYVSNNSLPANELPALIAAIHGAFQKITAPAAAPVVEESKQPAVPIKKSVTNDFIICLEDGKRFRSLKRHLGSVYGMTPDEYRAKWGLAKDYPMVAPAYSATRSQLAKKIGLGNKPAARPAAAPTNHVKTEKAPRGRPRKVAA